MKCKQNIFLFMMILLLFKPMTVEAGIVISGELTHEKEVAPGEKYIGVIVVQNQGAETEEVKVFQTDYLFYYDGSSFYCKPGEVPRTNSRWIQFSPKRFILPAGEEISVNYSVQVPDSDSLFGTYWSMIMVEPIPKSSPEQDLPERTIGLTTILRYGIQMVSHIGTSGRRELRFLEAELLNKEGVKMLQVDIENIGDRWLRPSVWVELYDAIGNHIGKFEGRQIRTYPGTSIRQCIDLTGVRPGNYKALIIADCGDDDLFGINYTLTISK